MVNSDNVVRGGLTPKLKDSATLCEILPYDARAAPQIWEGEVLEIRDNFTFKEFLTTQYQELRMWQVEVNQGVDGDVTLPQLSFLAIAIVLKGHCNFRIQNEALGHDSTHEAPTFSTWYITPGSVLTVTDVTTFTKIVLASPR